MHEHSSEPALDHVVLAARRREDIDAQLAERSRGGEVFGPSSAGQPLRSVYIGRVGDRGASGPKIPKEGPTTPERRRRTVGNCVRSKRKGRQR
jgi:hypothetical protein